MIPIEYFVIACIVFVAIMIRQWIINKNVTEEFRDVVSILGVYVKTFGDFNIDDDGNFKIVSINKPKGQEEAQK